MCDARNIYRAVIHMHLKRYADDRPPSHRNRSLASSKNTGGAGVVSTVQGLVGLRNRTHLLQ